MYLSMCVCVSWPEPPTHPPQSICEARELEMPREGALAEIQTECCHCLRFDHFLYAHLVFRASKMQMTANAAQHPDICTS